MLVNYSGNDLIGLWEVWYEDYSPERLVNE